MALYKTLSPTTVIGLLAWDTDDLSTAPSGDLFLCDVLKDAFTGYLAGVGVPRHGIAQGTLDLLLHQGHLTQEALDLAEKDPNLRARYFLRAVTDSDSIHAVDDKIKVKRISKQIDARLIELCRYT